MQMMLPSLWNIQTTESRCLLLATVGALVTSMALSARLAWRLFHCEGGRVQGAQLPSSGISPDRLARAGLANKIRCGTTSLPSSVAQISSTLRRAENVFVYFWEGCWADMEWIRRASVLIVLLSLSAVAIGAPSTFRLLHDGFHFHEVYSTYHTIFYHAEQLTIGLSLSALLYAISSYFERKLTLRKANWNYLCAKLGSDSKAE